MNVSHLRLPLLSLCVLSCISACATNKNKLSEAEMTSLKESLGIYTGKPVYPRSHEHYECTVESTYVWRDGKITLYKPGQDPGDFRLNIYSDGRAEMAGGSYDWDGKWTEILTLVEATETKRELAQPDSSVLAQSAVLRLIQNRNPKGQFDFNYRGGVGNDAVFKAGKCV